MNWGQFKDSLSYLWPVGSVVTCWSLKLEVAGSNSKDLFGNYFVTEINEFIENIQGQLELPRK